MQRPKPDNIDMTGSGNFLGKRRRSIFISNKCWNLMHELSLELGLSHSGIIEIATRMYYREMTGKPANITYTPERITK